MLPLHKFKSLLLIISATLLDNIWPIIVLTRNSYESAYRVYDISPIKLNNFFKLESFFERYWIDSEFSFNIIVLHITPPFTKKYHIFLWKAILKFVFAFNILNNAKLQFV